VHALLQPQRNDFPRIVVPSPPGRRHIGMRANCDLSRQFKLIWAVQSREKKHFAFLAGQITGVMCAFRTC
jgi:hypothetical protein